MKVALVCSFGGHLTELQYLSNSYEEYDCFYITYDNIRTRELDEQKYLLKSIDMDPVRMLEAFYRMGRIMLQERPDVILSTGSEIAIPAFVWGQLIHAETIYIESWCRVDALSKTGRLVYPLSDLFLVQWPELVEDAGEKARYEGMVL